MGLGEKVAAYAERHFQRSGKTEWPTVRQTARALGIRQRDLVDIEGDGHIMLTAHFVSPPETLGGHCVEVV